MRHKSNLIVVPVLSVFVAATASFAQPVRLAGVPCATPALMHCPSSNCPRETRQNPGSKGWGLLPRPGTADVFVYRGCKDGRVVADVMRIDKGYTEGLEPKITEELIKLMLGARGGKIQKGG